MPQDAEIFRDIKMLQWGPTSSICFIVSLYVCDTLYRKSFGPCFYARKSKVRGTDEICVDQERESLVGLLGALTECRTCLCLAHFVQFFPKLVVFYYVAYCNMGSKEQISSNHFIHVGIIRRRRTRRITSIRNLTYPHNILIVTGVSNAVMTWTTIKSRSFI
jgi:hypothetical protein